MEVRIGVKGAPRELVLDSNQSADDIQKAVDAALKDGAPTVTLTDEKGRRVVVATDKLAGSGLLMPAAWAVASTLSMPTWLAILTVGTFSELPSAWASVTVPR